MILFHDLENVEFYIDLAAIVYEGKKVMLSKLVS